VKLWDVAALLSPDADGTPLAILPHDDFVNGATWNADDTRILSWSSDGTAKLWDVAALLSPDADGTPLAILPHDDTVWGARWNADETRILTWSDDNTAKLWDVAALLSPDADGVPPGHPLPRRTGERRDLGTPTTPAFSPGVDG
jgi:WD40 repeat protein